MWSDRRDALFSALEDRHAAAVIPTNPEVLRSGDTHFRFRPDSSFYYLTGFPEPDAVAVFSPRHPEHRFVLFVRPRDPEKETWYGRRAGVEGARERYGADAAYPISELEDRLPDYLKDASTLYYPLGHGDAVDRQIQTAMSSARRFRRQGATSPSTLVDPAELIAEMRLFKRPEELERMDQAAQITVSAHMAAMAATRPGMNESQIEALLEYTFRRHGASGPGYTTIVGGGANATILHYVENCDPLRAGDMLLVDAGAEYDLYSADVTRTWPVNGRFTKVQRDAYDVVLAAQQAAIQAVRPGNRFVDPHDRAVEVLTQGLVDLGLLKGSRDELIESRAYRRYYMHNTGHWLGMDVHDCGDYREGPPGSERPWRRFEPGMVTTVEPGLYIPEGDESVPAAFRGLGIRIEDDLLVTETGARNLTEGCPKDPDRLEALIGTAELEPERLSLAS